MSGDFDSLVERCSQRLSIFSN